MSTVQVIAPATLDAGYTFEATVDGNTFTVTVPEEGVKEGQEFQVPYPCDESEDETERPKVKNEKPTGRWRFSLFSCCDVVMQATFWMSCFLCPVQLAQIMTRLNLNWKGQNASALQSAMTFSIVIILLVIALYLWMIPFVGTFIFLGYWLFIWYVGINTRAQMRKKYGIPTRLGDRADDCCCMLWCGCCSIIQMSRQTHDDKEYPGYCCTTTGLEPHAPEIELGTRSHDTLSDSGESDL